MYYHPIWKLQRFSQNAPQSLRESHTHTHRNFFQKPVSTLFREPRGSQAGKLEAFPSHPVIRLTASTLVV